LRTKIKVNCPIAFKISATGWSHRGGGVKKALEYFIFIGTSLQRERMGKHIRKATKTSKMILINKLQPL